MLKSLESHIFVIPCTHKKMLESYLLVNHIIGNTGSVTSIILGKGGRIEDGHSWDDFNSYQDRNDAIVQFGTMVVGLVMVYFAVVM
jgi:hypothetical protein